MIAFKDLDVGHVIAVPPEVKGAMSRYVTLCHAVMLFVMILKEILNGASHHLNSKNNGPVLLFKTIFRH